MTFVENTPSDTRAESAVTTDPHVRVETTTAAMPRVSATLEHRLHRGRTHRVRLGLTDATAIAIATGIAAVFQLHQGEPPANVAMRCVLLATVWFATLLAMRTSISALFGSSTAGHRGVAHAFGVVIRMMTVLALVPDSTRHGSPRSSPSPPACSAC